MKHPGTSGSIPIKSTGCGIRPDLDEMDTETSFDSSKAKKVFDQQIKLQAKLKNKKTAPK